MAALTLLTLPHSIYQYHSSLLFLSLKSTAFPRRRGTLPLLNQDVAFRSSQTQLLVHTSMDEQKPRRQGKLSNEAPKPKQKRKLPGEEIGGVLGRTRKAWMRKLGPKAPTKLNDTRLKRRSAKKQKSSEEAEAPLESTGVEPGLPENVSEHQEDVPEPQPVNSDVSIVRATKTTGQCFRIQNVPPAWSKYILLDFLRRADESLQSLDESDISLCPACSGPTQTALLYPEETPACLRWPEGQDSMRLRVSNDSEREKVDLEIDSNFYDLTPLYTPTEGEEIVAELVPYLCSSYKLEVMWLVKKLTSLCMNKCCRSDRPCRPCIRVLEA